MFNMQSLNMSKTLKKTTDSESKATNMRWTDDMDGFLLNVMLEEQSNGNRPNGTWSPHIYSKMSKKCSESFGYTVEKGNIKNRIKTLKGTFHSCHDLFKNISGFAWNPITGLFEAEDEVWEPLIEVSYIYFDIVKYFLDQVDTFCWYSVVTIIILISVYCILIGKPKC